MFFFKHPKPFSRKEVAVQVVARSSGPPPDTSVIIVESRPPAPAPVPVAAKKPPSL